MADEGIVYVLSNEAMPGLIKIGLTKRDELEVRLNGKLLCDIYDETYSYND